MVFYEISINEFLCGKFENGVFVDEHGEDVKYKKMPDIEQLNKEILLQMQQRDPKSPITSYRPNKHEIGKAKLINTHGQCGEHYLSSVAMIVYRCL